MSILPDQVAIESLRRWSHFLLWVSIILPLLAAAAAGARYYVERAEKRLSSRLTAAAIERAQGDASDARQDAGAAKQELLVLREKTAPRRLSQKERDAIAAASRVLHGAPVAVAYRMMDGESLDFASDIAAALREGGCQVPDLIKTSVNDFIGRIVVTRHGVVEEKLAKDLAITLRAAGLAVTEEEVVENSVGQWYQNLPHVIVGRKQP